MESFTSQLLARVEKKDWSSCTLETCPISTSVYGYLPSTPVSIMFIALFGVSFIIHLVQGIRAKSWTFLVALGVGSLFESVG